MNKKFLAIIPENSAPPALIGEALLENGDSYDAIYPMDRFASHSPLSYPGLPSEPGDYAGLIMMGGPMSANDTADHAFLQESMALIRGFGVARRPVLGVCLGAQVIARATVVCCDSIEDASLESGDLIEPIAAGQLDWLEVQELAQIVSGELPGRQADTDVVVFKSNGIAPWDLAIGEEVVRRARERGVGTEL